jgi:ankyrin repeat protein
MSHSKPQDSDSDLNHHFANLLREEAAKDQMPDIAERDMDLCDAAADGRLDVVMTLIEQGANIHAYDDEALREAAENGHLDVVKYLVEHGADIDACEGCALCWAAENGHLNIVKYLVAQGADLRVITRGEVLLIAAESAAINYYISKKRRRSTYFFVQKIEYRIMI